jgi:hypothetical protein
MEQQEERPDFLICIRNDGYAASLEPRKIYRALMDDSASARRFVRVIDESGEDYLYPEDYFVPIDLPQEARQAFAQAS